MRNGGFTFVEVMLSLAMTSVVVLLGFMAIQSAAESVEVADATADTLQSLRNVMGMVTQELEMASSQDLEGLCAPIHVSESMPEVTFQVPLDDTGESWSDPITYLFENEDTDGDAQLDDGEDTNGDGVLTRRLVRLQGDTEMILAAANNLHDVDFDLSDDGRMLTVTLVASQEIGMTGDKAESVITSSILLMN